jgi:hypothetical protein
MNKTRFCALIIPIIGSLMFSYGCSDKGLDNKPFVSSYAPNYQYNNYSIATNLDWSQRWHTYAAALDYVNNYPHDENGIALGFYNGQYFYHPFMIACHAIYYLNSYRETGDSTFLNVVYRYANKLSEIGHRFHGGIYFPYSITAPIHGSGDILTAPWYSGFAQGYALSLYSRIYETTGDRNMKALADSVFQTMVYTDTSSNAWTSMIDSAGYYWIEEYPYTIPEHVFNGFMFGIFGLHDYYMITHDRTCELIIDGSCTTIAHYFSDWRNPGGACCYCLRHRHVDPFYHETVTGQLRQIALITGDPIFNADADSLYSDYH